MIRDLVRVDGATVGAGFPEVTLSRTVLSEATVLGTAFSATVLGTAFSATVLGTVFSATNLGAALFASTGRLGTAALAADLRDVDFVAEVALIFADTDFLAAIFPAVGVLAPLAVFCAPILTEAVLTVAVLTAGFRLTATFRAAIFSLRPFGARAFAPRGLFAFADAVLTWETFTSPRMARPAGRVFAAAAFAVGRRIGLLRGVEAMGNALVTVATCKRTQWHATQNGVKAPPSPVDTGE
jgi:hypothetical protein